VADAESLAAVWAAWLADPAAADRLGERGRALIEENRGALERTLGLLAPWLKSQPVSMRLVAGGAST
jgi:3-deoxy-D-manno-octulosonic-acid transferase